MRHKINFVSLEPISLHMHRVRFKRPVDFTFKPGQFINVFLDDKQLRSYSVSSHPSDEYIDLTIRFPQGSRARKFFESLKKGDEVTIMGPFGRYVYNETSLEKVHVVTGAGIGPNFSMIAEWMLQGAQQKSLLFFGVQEFENIPYLEQFKQWQQAGLQFYPCLSQQGGDGNVTFSGRVQKVLLDKLNDFHGKEFYICGQPAMVGEVVSLLKEQGVDDDVLFYEKFESA